MDLLNDLTWCPDGHHTAYMTTTAQQFARGVAPQDVKPNRPDPATYQAQVRSLAAQRAALKAATR